MAVLQQYRILRLIMILIIVLLTIFLYASYYTNQSAMLVIPAPASNAAAGRLHNTFGLALPSSSSSSSGSIIIDPLLSKASTSKSSASSSQLLLINNNNNHNNNLIPSNDERNIVVAMVVKNENNNGGNTADDNEQREMGDDDNNDIGGGIIIGPPPQPPQPPQNLDSTNSIEMEEKLTKLLLLNSKKDLIDLNPNGDMLIENNDEIDDNNNINKNNNEDNHEHNHNHDDHDDDDDVDVDGGVMGKDENSVDLPNALQNKQIQDDINKSSLLLAAPSLVDVPKQQLIEYAGAAAAADVSNQSQSKSVNTSLNIIAADESSAAAAAASGRIGGSAQMKPKKSVETEPAAAAAAAIIILNNDKTKMEENHRGGGSGGGDNNNNNNNHHHSGDGHYPSGSILASAVRIPLHTAPQHQQSLQSNNNTVGIVNKIGGGGGGGVAAAGTPPLNNGKKNDTSTIDGTKAIRAGDLYGSGGHLEPINNELCPDYGEMLRLLIIITSAPAHREARLAIRQTWGHYSIRRDISIAFILGETVGGGGGGQSSAIEEALNAENFMYGDLIRGHFLDSYNNLTLKTISTLEWVTRNCPKVTFILKTDDDMFINVPKLLAFIEKHQTDERVIFGRLAKKWKPIRNKKSKYYVSPQQYYPPIFPAFTTGPAYLMTSDIIKDLYEKSLNQTYLKLEDVFTTGIVAQLINAKRVHVNEFLNRRIAFNPCNIRKAISVHMVKSNEQFDLWKKLFDTNTKCK